MIVTFPSRNYCNVQKEDRDTRIYSDSALLYAMKKILQRMGLDVVKKLMHKDGHLVSDDQHYLRDRKGRFLIYWGYHAVRSAYEDFNTGTVMFISFIQASVDLAEVMKESRRARLPSQTA